MKHLKLFEDFREREQTRQKIEEFATKIWTSKDSSAIEEMEALFSEWDLGSSNGFDPEDLHNLHEDEAEIVLSQLYKISLDAKLYESFPLEMSEITDAWKNLYGEDFETEYPAAFEELGSSFTLEALENVWKDLYGENFAEQYPAVYIDLFEKNVEI